MNKTTHSDHKQVNVPPTLDVMAVERELNELWKRSAGAVDEAEAGALMRARVLNLMVWVETEEARGEADELLGAVSSVHPCRALVLFGERGAADQDIEMFVSSRCQSRGAAAGANRLCGEQVTLRARGSFTVELPSAATPLLVSDLPVFLWWRDEPRVDDQTFARLCRASDRVIIDSAGLPDPHADLTALAALLQSERGRDAAVSDLDWARLTSWRTLLANFYDVAEYRAELEGLSRVRVEYVASEKAPDAIAPQALILAGWLASRLGWNVSSREGTASERVSVKEVLFEKAGRRIVVEFQKIEGRDAQCKGSLTRIELHVENANQTEAVTAASSSSSPSTPTSSSTFVISESVDGQSFETQASVGEALRASRVVCRSKHSEAELIERELEILTHDHIYEEAIARVAEMLKVL
jgi:glucose-6-phosphate dehydrogenase assembly protein OpcA